MEGKVDDKCTHELEDVVLERQDEKLGALVVGGRAREQERVEHHVHAHYAWNLVSDYEMGDAYLKDFHF